ncbi:MAG: 2-oxo acid dehydrogenase subunit E2 [Candidatus Omnitrophica bacterium]|nr:2-oxo acid dehydrogenase subunit E2 [Candidatus Omnitrophota bacterium]
MDIKIPFLADGVTSGTVVSVLIQSGDQVKKDQTILEIETDKAVAPIPAPEAGTVDSILIKEGDSVSVGQSVVRLSGGGSASAAKSEPQETKPAAAAPAYETGARPASQPPVVASGTSVAASPTVRKVAREIGIDLSRVRGTENGGRISIHDLRDYVQYIQNLAFQQGQASAVNAPAAAAPAKALESIDFSKWGKVSKKPFTSLRKVIAERMSESKQTIPHVTIFEEADITALMALRKKQLGKFEKKGVRLTLTAFIIKAVASSLKKNPIFNSSLDETAKEIVLKEYVHLGIAVDTEAGLIVPVLRDADQKSVLDIAKDLASIAEKARSRTVAVEEMKGGSFTISNQGGIGGAHFTPVINKPESAILGLGKSRLKAVVVDGKIESRMMMPVCVSYDHRIIDGGDSARFIVDLTEAIQNFDTSTLGV